MRCLAFVLFLIGIAWPSLAREPLKVPDIPEFYQRVLTMPFAPIVPQPVPSGAPGQKAVAMPPVFTVLYVYERRKVGDIDWLAVGTKAQGEPDGWMPALMTHDWKTMLVMQFAPRGQRERVMTFGNRDTLVGLVRHPQAPTAARGLLRGAIERKPDVLKAVNGLEPAEAIDYKKAPYLMPIFDWKFEEFDDGTRTTLTRIASVTTEKDQPKRDDPTKDQPPVVKNEPPKKPDMKDFRLGLVFVIDTTRSMGPYIERTREAMRRVYGAIEKDGNLQSVNFGLVAYRNSTKRDARVEYVTRIVQPLDRNASPADVLKRIGEVKEAQVPTPGWDEDAYAGLYEAMNKLDWTPYAARLAVVITDAGALPGKSEFAQFKNVDMPNIVELAQRKKIVIAPVHLQTPEAARVNNVERAQAQWTAIGKSTGDVNNPKFYAVEGGAVEGFDRVVNEIADQVREAFVMAKRDEVPQPCCAAPPQGAAPAQPSAAKTSIARALVNEIFRARLEYIGTQEGTQAPQVLAGWVSDKDLTNPRFTALEPKVFLTRNQLNGLAGSLTRVVNEAKRASLAPETFFDLLQSLAATTAADPNRGGAAGQFSNLAESNLLPSYLKALPYRSKVLRVTKQSWIDLGMTGQQEFIDELEYKLKLYQDMYQDTASWVDFGAKDPGLFSYAVPLETLP